ncbi:MAG: hypothetical protein A3H27_07960 [Acidobacteria bacterium RIFCSPLOWO2_02_FULL_59_13]|nr:MAG: hypothetical protein A3H27_07960 [Acidobacteria bacterium RIFCSPLOWO2_02_FULL_59_13]
MNYWLDLFSGTTWKEFKEAGSRITGFSQRMRRSQIKVKAGDIFLCYLTGVMRWVGALEVVGKSNDQRRIWKDAEFPIRFEVKSLVMLDPEYGILMKKLAGKVDFYRGPQDAGKFRGFVRMSPNLFKRNEDGKLILTLLQEAQNNPKAEPVDPKKLARKPFFKAEARKGKITVSALVTVPEPVSETETAPSATVHTEMQYHLLELGADMGLDVWVARNDRSKVWKGVTLGAMSRLVDELPTQFNEATHRTIELIDVLWLKGNSIVAAFEVESTTSIYSGLLRMGDLLALQPNLDIRLYLVAPDDRRDKVEQEISRPTFKLRERPLPEVCGFLSFSKLIETVTGIRTLGLASSLKPDFLQKIAEFFGSESE